MSAKDSPPSKPTEIHQNSVELIKIDISQLNAITWCSSCSGRLRNPHYKCYECQNYHLCKQCHENASTTHLGHGFEVNDLAARIKSQVRERGLKAGKLDTDKAAVMGRVVPLNCCPTCFDHRPVMSLSPPGTSETSDGSDVRFSYHDVYVSDIGRSAERGCSLCSVIYQGLQAVAPTLVKEDGRLQWDMFDRQIKISDFKGRFKDSFNYQIYAASEDKTPFGLNSQPVEFHKSFKDAMTFRKIERWMASCKQHHSHPQCKSPSSSVLPHRVITIDKFSGTPRLRLSEMSGNKGQYVALSHCWGKEQILTTKLSTLGSMTQEIPFDKLPATFVDAVYCCQMLAIQYLWIDSLCIIQDDASDWERESARMDGYYADADLVIVAARSPGDKVGFLKDRPAKYVGVPLEAEKGSGNFDVIFQHKMPHLNPSGLRSRTEMLDDMTAARAWCMQEIVLARRSVFFHESELVWECQSLSDCECGMAAKDFAKYQDKLHHRPFVMRESDGSVSFMDVAQFFEYHMKPLSNFYSVEAIFEEWKRGIVPMYTAKQLTKATDKLPALSGLASFVAQALKTNKMESQYIAGLWRQDLQLGLLWSLVDRPHEGGFQWPPPEKARPMPTTYLGPSFSWVSVDNEVIYNLPHVEDGSPYGDATLEVIEAGASVIGLNPFGTVNSGYIRVSGFSRQLEMISTGMPTHPLSIQQDDLWDDVDFMADTYLAEVTFQATDGTLVRSINRSTVQQSVEIDPVLIDALLVAEIPYRKDDRFPRRQVKHEYAMILLGKVPSPLGSYQRIGLLTVCMSPENAEEWIRSAAVHEYTII